MRYIFLEKSKYADFADVFSLKLDAELSEYTGTNDYAIKLINNQELSYSLMYDLGPVELETFKIYIKNNRTRCYQVIPVSYSSVHSFW